MGKNVRFVVLIGLVLVVATATLSAQYFPPNGGTNVPLLMSPSFLAGYPSIVSSETPQASGLNPAASGLKQRTTLDLSYLSLIDFGGEGWGGNILNLGATHPTKVGVFDWTAHLYSSGLTDVSLGTFGALKASFAKDLFPDFLVGLGLNGTFGSNGASDWSVTGDIGFINFLSHSYLQDLRWAIVLKDIGKGFAPLADRSSYPPSFTPIVGIGFTFLDTDFVDLGLTTDLSLPSFQNVRLGIGLESVWGGVLGIQTSTYLDIAELTDDQISAKSFVPSFGVSFSFETDIQQDSDFLSMAERGWGKTSVKTQAAAGPLQGDVWGIGFGANVPLGVIDRLPPELELSLDGEPYISPNLDGTLDDVIFPISIEDQRYISGYRLSIEDDRDVVVKTIVNKDDRPENEGFKNIMQRLTAVKKGIDVPQTLRWDGIGDDGEIVGDGTYSVYLESWDDNGNIGITDEIAIYVDNTAPQVTVVQPDALERIFSPNADGNKDTITLEQSGSSEDVWTGNITDAAGNTVKTFDWTDSEPKEFVWDGTDSNGVLAPDGVYGYRISALDRAGNAAEATLGNIIINTQATPISINISDSYFSPNSDGVKDTLTATLNVPVTAGVVSWKLEILDTTGAMVASQTGEDTLPSTVVFDGRSNSGSVLPEGDYKSRLSVSYLNGNQPVATSPTFTVDVTPPQATVRTDLSLFSPNGDGNKDIITVFHDTSAEDSWIGTIYGTNDETVKTFEWIRTADPKIDWDGRGKSGRVMADGEYSYFLTSTDRAGNSGKSNLVTFTLSTEETPVFITADLDSFSPNTDGQLDTLSILPQLKIVDGVESYELRIVSRQNQTIRTFSGRGAVPEAFSWEGLDDSGRRAPDGEYRSEILIRYRNGNEPVAQSRYFRIDTDPPQVSTTVDRMLFSPNNDGKKDKVSIFHETTAEDLWEGRIIAADGTVIRKAFWKGSATSFVWDGSDENGNAVPDGSYTYVVFAQDAAGNYAESRISGIEVDTQVTQVFATVNETGFSPNGDGIAEEVTFNIVVNVTNGLTGWKFEIIHQDGAVEKQFSGDRLPKRITWNGQPDSGGVREGTYRGVFTASYEKGDEPSGTTNPFFLDITPPDTKVSLSPTPFSPDNDGVDDELRIAFEVADQSGVDKWRFEVLDPKGNPFLDFGGNGAPTTAFFWDGRSNRGELVQAAEDYPYRMTVQDGLGNVRSTEGRIPIDILVLRDGDRLKIRISNISFAPNSPEFKVDDPEILEKNRWVIERISEIFDKYARYNIRIEGHAVSVYWDDAERAKREQEEELIPLSLARAETVKNALAAQGIDAARISTKGMGGSEPIVPHSDLENRWKNRRVEFILIR